MKFIVALLFLTHVLVQVHGTAILGSYVVGTIDLYAGTGLFGFGGDGGPATKAIFSSVTGVALNSVNNLLYIVDYGNYRIRVVNR
jgi:hypothetical protein